MRRVYKLNNPVVNSNTALEKAVVFKSDLSYITGTYMSALPVPTLPVVALPVLHGAKFRQRFAHVIEYEQNMCNTRVKINISVGVRSRHAYV
jgi:hypothetical protein